MKGLVRHARDQYFGARNVPFDVADRASISHCKPDAKVKPSRSGAERNDIVGRCSHIKTPQ